VMALQKVVVFGGTGFLGRRVAQLWRSRRIAPRSPSTLSKDRILGAVREVVSNEAADNIAATLMRKEGMAETAGSRRRVGGN
jgi:hypothetical protein